MRMPCVKHARLPAPWVSGTFLSIHNISAGKREWRRAAATFMWFACVCGGGF